MCLAAFKSRSLLARYVRFLTASVGQQSAADGARTAGRDTERAAAIQALKRKFTLEDRGEVQVKGKGSLYTYFLTGRRAVKTASGAGPPATLPAPATLSVAVPTGGSTPLSSAAPTTSSGVSPAANSGT